MDDAVEPQFGRQLQMLAEDLSLLLFVPRVVFGGASGFGTSGSVSLPVSSNRI